MYFKLLLTHLAWFSTRFGTIIFRRGSSSTGITWNQIQITRLSLCHMCLTLLVTALLKSHNFSTGLCATFAGPRVGQGSRSGSLGIEILQPEITKIRSNTLTHLRELLGKQCHLSVSAELSTGQSRYSEENEQLSAAALEEPHEQSWDCFHAWYPFQGNLGMSAWVSIQESVADCIISQNRGLQRVPLSKGGFRVPSL